MIRQLVSSSNYSLHFSGTSPIDWNGNKQFLASFTSAFPDLTRNVEDMVAEGDRVAVIVNVTGTHKGELRGVQPTGKKVSFTSMEILTINDGKIVEERAIADRMGLMQQN